MANIVQYIVYNIVWIKKDILLTGGRNSDIGFNDTALTNNMFQEKI